MEDVYSLMKIFYSKRGKVLGRAWAFMPCKNKEEHKPHSWDSKYMSYGPYMCPGNPPIDLYDTPPRHPVNRKRSPK